MARFIDTLMQRGQSMQESLDRQLEERRIQREAEAAKVKAKRDAELANSRAYHDWASGKKPGAELIDGTLYPKSISTPTKKREQSRMGSDANIDRDRIGKGSFTANTPPKRATKPPVARNTTSEYVAPPSPESAQTAGIQGLPGGQSGVSQEAGSDYGRTTYFGETPEAATQVAQQMRKGLFGEDISQEDYDAMTQRNKDASFFGRFKKGGQVKKKTAKKASGGSVSSASKRGDGCCQRGKTKGRMV